MIYIRGIGSISPLSDGNPLLPASIAVADELVLKCQEPDYQSFIGLRLLRRMARIIKMGVSTSKLALTDAGIQQPEAIITGTGLGCCEDTNNFLQAMIRDKETLLSPTAFIKSTHNTIAGQIALLLENNSYNMTYAHRGFSFESALLDAMLLLREGAARDVLVGGVDELTVESTRLLQQLGCIKSSENDKLPKGGEGASFFVLQEDEHPDNYASIQAVGFSYCDPAEEALSQFLLQHHITPEQVDLTICGAHSSEAYERAYHTAITGVLPGSTALWYKHLCGESFTSSAFACWLAAAILKAGEVPAWLDSDKEAHHSPNAILIYDQSANKGHSFILLKKC